MKSSEIPVFYRLRGELDGVEHTFFLHSGEHRIGRSPSSDVRLPVEGVSREHAMLRAAPGGLVVEDRGSKNGTFVNQSRVKRSSVPSGAVLGFGPVDLVAEVSDVEDVELALVVDPGAEIATEQVLVSTTSPDTATVFDRVGSSVAERWLRLLEGFAENLFVHVRGETNAALAYLVETLGAAGSCLVEWTDGHEPVVLAAHGQLGELAPPPEVPIRGSPSFSLDAAVVRAALASGDLRCLELRVWGDFEDRSRSQVLLWTLLRLLDRVHRWERRGSREAGELRTSDPDLVFPKDYRPGVSLAMKALYQKIRTFAQGDLPVLITGETGVGKERLAELLHLSSERCDRPFLALNCAAIPAELLEAELFGIGKGVATGVDARRGTFQRVDGGTLFLDEIGEMQPVLQAKLLRVLQEKQIQPVGGVPREVDLRIVAATNADLERRMDEGTFRRDLYYRLTGFELEVPPLRECPEDLPHLIEHFLVTFARERGISVRGVTVKAFRRLLAYPWPGNVRELRQEVQRLVYQCSDGDVVDAEKLSRRLAEEKGGAETAAVLDGETLTLESRLRQFEKPLILEALRRAKGRQVRAAQLLGISRNGLAEKLKRLGIDPWDYRKEK